MATKIIKVFGLEISDKVFPKLYKLGIDNYKKMELVLSLGKEYFSKLTAAEVATMIETAQPVEIMGKTVDVFEFPAIYCWYTQKPDEFEKFFNDTVVSLWGGDTGLAFRMIEEYFERSVK